MVYLALAVASSAAVSLVMRLGEQHVKNKMAMFMVNYGMCLLLARSFMGQIRLFTNERGIAVPLGLGLLSGILYLVNFILLQKSMEKNGVVLSSTFMKLGVLVPTILAIVAFGELPKVVQVLGVLIAVIAIVIVNFEKEHGIKEKGFKESAVDEKVLKIGVPTKNDTVKDYITRESSKGMLMALLLISGITDSMANIYDKTGQENLKDHYLFYTFFAALLVAFLLVWKKKEKTTMKDVLFGALLGIPNYFASRFLLLSLEEIPAVITYPVYSVATIVIITIVSTLAFKEQLSKRKMLAMGLILISLVLLNI